MIKPNEKRGKVRNLREIFKRGTRIELINMVDKYSKLKPGERGSVDHVDDMGTIHMKWDCGSSLGLIPGVDDFKVIERR